MTDIFEILKEYADYLHVSGILSWALRNIGWFILSGVKGLLDGMEKVLDFVYKLAEFPMSNGVTDFINQNKVAVFAIGSICMIIFFIRYMNNRNIRGKSLIDNLLMGTMVVVASGTIIATLTTGSFNIAKSIYAEGGSTSTAIYNENITDVLSFDQDGWSGKGKVKHIDYTEEQYQFLDITQQIDEGKVKFENPKVSKEVFSHKVQNNAKNELEKVKLDKGFLKVDEHYYRYSWHPWTIFWMMLISIVVLGLASFKYLHAMYNIGFNSIIVPFFAYSDLVEGSKVKKIIQGILNILMNVVLFAVSLKVYRLFSNYISEQKGDGIIKLFLQLVLILILIEGPWIIQELTGYQGGLKSAVGQLATLAAAGVVGAKGLGKMKEALPKAKDAMNKAADFVSGAAEGALESAKSKLNIGKDMKEASETDKPPTDLTKDDLSEQERKEFSEAVKSDLSQASSDGKESSSIDKDSDLRSAAEQTKDASPEENSDLRQAENSDQPTAEDLKPHRETKVPASMQDLMGSKFGANEPTSEGANNEDLPKSTPSETASKLENKGIEAISPKGSPKLAALASAMALHQMGQASLSPAGSQELPEGSSIPLGATGSLPPKQSIMSRSQAKQQLSGNTLPFNVPPAQTVPVVTALPENIMRDPGVHQFKRNLTPSGVPYSQTQLALSGIPLQTGTKLPGHVSVPKSISSLPGVQQFQSDLQNKPLTNLSAQDILKDKLADWQVKRSDKLRDRQKTRQIGANSSKELLGEKEGEKDE